MNEQKILKGNRIRGKKDSTSFLNYSVPTKTIKRKTNYILNNVVSLLIYLFTFFIFHYIRKGTLLLEYDYYILLGFLTISLILGALLSNKFSLTVQHELRQALRKLTISLILSFGFLSLTLLVFDASSISRALLLWAMLSGFVLESFYYYLISERRKKIRFSESTRVSLSYLLIDGFILSLFCYFEIIENIRPEKLNEKHFIMLIAVYVIWLFSAGATHKFQLLSVVKTQWNAFGLQMKFYLLIVSLTLLTVFLLRIDSPYWGYFTEGVLKYSLASGVLAFLLFAERIRGKTDEAITLFLKAYEHKEHAAPSVSMNNISKYVFEGTQVNGSSLESKLQFEYLKEYAEVFTFIERKLDLRSFDISKTLVTRSVDTYNINVLQPGSQQLIVNMQAINDQNKINNYLRELNKRLVKGGIFVGSMIPNKNRYHRYRKKYPFLISNLFYLVDFIWKRVFPKLPIAKKIYFMLSKGKDRAISLAEGLGRLVFCGFEILDLTKINNHVYFLVAKVKETNYEKNPYYSPIFKMKRVGEGGKTIYVYKFRTMHPYSELIHQLTYESLGSLTGDKINHDFRVSAWGNFLRKYWLDEIPMLLNLVKGDLKLFGVRPLSIFKLSLYPKDFQNIRIKAKPGLVPPYYFDLPNNFEELVESEKRYLNSYFVHPFKTDLLYFLKAVKNILIMEKRSA